MYEGPVQNLIDELSKLPGVGRKSAQRIAFHLLNADVEQIDRLKDTLSAVSGGVTYCEVCGTVSSSQRCRICADERRNRAVVCVVEEPKDVEAIERTRDFDGLYHVLGGSLEPTKGIGPDNLRIRELLQRVGHGTDGVDITEVIIATDPNVTGEATSAYISRLLRNFEDLTVSRIAAGLPIGGELEFADEITISKAMAGRRVITTARHHVS